MLVGCLVGGVIIGLGGGVTTKAFVFTSLLTIPAFSNMGLYAVAVLAAFFTAMILVIVSGYRSPEEAAAAAAAGVSVADLEGPMSAASSGTLIAAAATKAAGDAGVVTEIQSPLAGTIVALGDVPDPVFSRGTLGPGIAVIPSGDTAYAPGSGVVVAAQPTGHAFGLLLDSGVEVLIHIGIDTVKLKGAGFDVHVVKGQRVTAGTPLVTFDRRVIDEAGYPLVTPIIILNAKKFGPIEATGTGETTVGATILTVAPAPVPAEVGL
jgi:PTS system beta-glucosides-specific IIC component